MKRITHLDTMALPRAWYWKSDLCRLYGVDKKTLNKWVAHFCPAIDTQDFKRRRKISPEMFHRIVQTLGEPDGGANVLRKNQIIVASESSYPVVRQFVRMFPEKCSFTLEVYDKLSAFPPLIARSLLNALE